MAFCEKKSAKFNREQFFFHVKSLKPDRSYPVLRYISIFGQKESKKGMVPLNKNCREGPHLVGKKKFQPDWMKGLEVMRFFKMQILILSKILTVLVNMQFW